MLISLVPHEMTFLYEDGSVRYVIPASGKVARLEQVSGPEEKMVFEVNRDTFLTLDMDSQVLGNVVLETPEGKEPMPPPEKGIFYIVSMPVAMALRRPDLLSR